MEQLKLVIFFTNVHTTPTEFVLIAQCMVSIRGAKENYLRPIPELGLELIPALDDKIAGSDASQKQLYDLFLPTTALNCPHPKVRNRPNGHITGDLFEEIKPGYYAFRERF